MQARSKPITVVVTLLIAVSLAAQPQSALRPNVIFFLADDLGVMDIGATNPKTFYATPNLDALAKSGMRFYLRVCGLPGLFVDTRQHHDGQASLAHWRRRFHRRAAALAAQQEAGVGS